MAQKAKLTKEEIRARRNEASKRWYAAHKAKGAKNRAVAKPERAKQILPAAKKAVLIKKDPNAPIMKRVEKLVKKNIKAVSQVKGLMKEVTSILTDAFKTGDEKLIASVQKTLAKNLCLVVDPRTLEPEGKAKKVVSFDVGAKCFRVPKRLGALAGIGEDKVDQIPAVEAETADEDEDRPVEIATDPNKLEDVENGALAEADIDPLADEDELDEDEPEDEETDEDEDDVDEDELTDEEREERAARRAERDEADYQEDYLSGREDMMREMGAMGMGEED